MSRLLPDDEVTLRVERTAAPDDQTLDVAPGHESSVAATSATLRPGDVFAGAFQIVACAGRGGFSFVYKARNRATGETVALKFLSGGETAPDLARRMQRELYLARDLRHPNIVRVHDLLESEGALCLVMEYVEGSTLKELVQARRPLPVKEAVRILVSLTSAMAAVHAAGIVHRDLKPQNVVVTEGDAVKLLDFGLAKTSRSTGLTTTGTILGTPDYMSPEQVEGRAADARSDIYSLGVIGWELLAGETPFRGDNALATALQHVRSRVPDVRRARPETPLALAQLLARMTDVGAARRPASALDVLQELERIAGGRLEPPSLLRRTATRVAAVLSLLAAGGALFLLLAPRIGGNGGDPFADRLVHVAVLPVRAPDGTAPASFARTLSESIAARLEGRFTRVHALSADEARAVSADAARARRAGIEQLVELSLSQESRAGFAVAVSVRDTASRAEWRGLGTHRFPALDFETVEQLAPQVAAAYARAVTDEIADRVGR